MARGEREVRIQRRDDKTLSNHFKGLCYKLLAMGLAKHSEINTTVIDEAVALILGATTRPVLAEKF